jgi:hypothetical protein
MAEFVQRNMTASQSRAQSCEQDVTPVTPLQIKRIPPRPARAVRQCRHEHLIISRGSVDEVLGAPQALAPHKR